MSLGVAAYVLIAVLLAGYAVLDGFDLGVGASYPVLGRSEAERRDLRRSIGPVWDGNEVWLITVGGILFAAFPPVYAAVFSGFYLAFMLLLLGLILRATSLEFKGYGKKGIGMWDVSFVVGSALPAFLFGVAAGNLVRGIPLSANGDYAGGFLDLLNPYALLVGLTGLAMCISHGTAWAAVKTTGALYERSVRYRSHAHWVFAGVLIAQVAATALAAPDRFSLTLERPLGLAFLVLLAGGFAWARISMTRRLDLGVFLGSALTVVSLIGLWATSLYPYLVPPPSDKASANGSAAGGTGAAGGPEQTGITIDEASSSDLALGAVLVAALIGMPLVIAYTAYVYHAFRGRLEPESDSSGSGY